MVTVLAFRVVRPVIVTVKGLAGAVKSNSVLAASMPQKLLDLVGLNACITTVVAVKFAKETEGLAAQVPLNLHQKSLDPILVLLIWVSVYHSCPPVTEMAMTAVVFLTVDTITTRSPATKPATGVTATGEGPPKVAATASVGFEALPT